jgi:UDP:flavonoid glycosyltransferase YjiC (YdhE family)
MGPPLAFGCGSIFRPRFGPSHPVPTLVCYISGHGFGHASRTIELLNALVDRAPTLQLQVRSEVARWLFSATARASIAVTAVACDTGAVQIDSLQLDEKETIRQAEQFMRQFPARVDAEARALRAVNPTLVLADAPPLGIAAAGAAGVPAILLGNFTWDWIYRAYEGGAAVADEIGAVYARSSLALRLPLHGGFETCPRIRDLPFIARRATREGAEVRAALGLPADRPLALVSFGGYGVEGLDLNALSDTDGFGIVMTGTTLFDGVPLRVCGATGALLPLDEPLMYARGYRYEDVVRAVDVVVTKPGYGIVAECAANDTAILYTSRGHFAEYDVLVAGMPRYVRARFIDRAALLAGRWSGALTALMAQPASPGRPDVSGADVAADLLLGMI